MDLLAHVFAPLCGQVSAHTWAPGGVGLPVCQRCTGLYAGALAALALQHLLRPVVTRGWLWLHGCFLLLMVPFGFHLVPQDAVLRAATGLFFGAGLVAFLRLPLPGGSTQPATGRTPPYLLGLLLALALVAWLGTRTSAVAGILLAAAIAGGVLVLWGLALACLAVAVRRLVGRLRMRAARISA
jgi:uncharacterized membrane protein